MIAECLKYCTRDSLSETLRERKSPPDLPLANADINSDTAFY